MKLALALLPLLAHATSPTDISTVYSYQCEGNFLEGEGVTPYQIDCLPYQRLGFLKAKFTAHLFQAESENNFHEKSPDKPYSSSICGRALPRLSCGTSTPEKKFGLSRRPEGIFQTKVILSPGFSAYSRVYGYAASTEANGGCPNGLIKARYFVAKPKTIRVPLPSSFDNELGGQNDRIVQVEGEPLPAFAVFRRSNTEPCDGAGNCANAVVGPEELAQTAAYEPESGKQAICVIPRTSLRK